MARDLTPTTTDQLERARQAIAEAFQEARDDLPADCEADSVADGDE